MIRTGIIAGLLAAFTIPAFAEDATVKQDTQATTNQSTENAAASKDDATVGSVAKDGHDCMRRRNAALDMM